MLRRVGKVFSFLTVFLLWVPQVIAVQPVEAAPAGLTFTVDSTEDLPDGNGSDNICLTVHQNCTLRAAIDQANATLGMDTIHLPGGVYKLTIPGVDDLNQKGDLDISEGLVIQGAGPDRTIVDANGGVTGDRAFHILATAGQTALSGMTVRGGDSVYTTTSQDAGFGGGIYQDGGDLSLTDMGIVNNQATYGGGLVPSFFNRAGTTTLERVTVRTNQALAYGGGIYLIDVEGSGSARLAVTHSTVSGNTAQYGGGVSFQGFGFNGMFKTSLDLTNTTVSGNTVDHDGGGIYDLGGLVQLANVTIADNQVFLPAGDNLDPGGGGMITVSANGFTPILKVKNSVIANNIRHKEGISFSFQDDCKGAITSFGHNLFGSIDGCTFTVIPSDLTSVDPLLGPLQNNGSSTQTHALLPGSPAIDGGNPNGCIDFSVTIVTTDQRGLGRPANLVCDIGAYEYYADVLDIPLVSR